MCPWFSKCKPREKSILCDHSMILLAMQQRSTLLVNLCIRWTHPNKSLSEGLAGFKYFTPSPWCHQVEQSLEKNISINPFLYNGNYKQIINIHSMPHRSVFFLGGGGGNIDLLLIFPPFCSQIMLNNLAVVE